MNTETVYSDRREAGVVMASNCVIRLHLRAQPVWTSYF